MNNPSSTEKKDASMPNFAFRMMSWIFNIMDIFRSVDCYIDDYGITEGFVVMDYGCGPGRYIRRASELVGEKGKVYAVDIHELAMTAVKKLIKKYSLTNVEAFLSDGSRIDLESGTVNLIYALDMFHMVKNTDVLLKEWKRIVKLTGVLILEDGHQPRESTREKVLNSGAWSIEEETKKTLICRPN
ncbi:MAG: class I SAM-dependent methyltransferase [Bacteroidales bacterium]|nr:class I SAM-dependent methyltransferase [Bacteroidales bacterium]